ncbi:MAG: hypothetical protein U0174_15200 [Polyangiaceae bacterium]
MLPRPSKDDLCHLEDTEGTSGLVIEDSQGRVFARLEDIEGVERVEVSLDENKKAARVSLETSSLVLHGESKVERLVVYPKTSDAFARVGVSYRRSSRVEPGSVGADGRVALAAERPYGWVAIPSGSPFKAPGPSDIRVACNELSLRSLRDPKHLSRFRENVSFVRRGAIAFRAKPGEAPLLRFSPPPTPSMAEPDTDVLLLSGKTATDSEVDVRIGAVTHVVGWVATRSLDMTLGAKRIDLRGGHAPPEELSYRACQRDTPLWALVRDSGEPSGEAEWVEFGHVKAGRGFRGITLPNGDYRVDLEDESDWIDNESPSRAFARITVANGAIGGCAPITREQYLKRP